MSASACTWRRVTSRRHAGQHLPVGRRGTEGMLAVAVSPDSTLLAIACRDG